MRLVLRILALQFVLCFYCALNLNPVLAEGCKLRILNTNDVHGRLLPFKLGISDYDKEVGGIARRYTLINQLKEENINTNILLLDAGDFAQGTIFFNIYNGLPDVQFMNKLHYDAVAVGNHEFDKGPEALAKMIKEAEFPFLAANLKFEKTSPLYKKVKPYIIKDFGCCKVGIIGLIVPDIKIITNVGKETEVLDPVQTANKYIEMLDKKTDVIIILSHLGIQEDKNLAAAIRKADIIIGGHSHTQLNKELLINDLDNNPVIIVQTGEMGKYLGDIQLTIDNDQITLDSYKLHSVDSTIALDQGLTDQLKGFQLQIDKVSSQIIGSTSSYINLIRDEVRTRETTGGNFIVDAIKDSFPEADIVFHNGGGIRGDKILHPGNLSMLDIIELHPFQDEVILVDVKGKDLKSILERSVASLPFSSGGFLQVSGMSFLADVAKKPQTLNLDFTEIVEPGERISRIMVKDKPIDENKTYRIATNRFIVNGGNGYVTLKNASTNLKKTGTTITDVLESYLKKYSPVSPAVEDRIKIINIPNKVEQ